MYQADVGFLPPSKSSKSSNTSEPDTHFYLRCWWHDTDCDPDDLEYSKNPIKVKIDKKLDFNDLKTKIKEAIPNQLKGIDAGRLRLWMVESPLVRGYVDFADATSQATGEPIPGATPLVELFKETPPGRGYLNIVVRSQGMRCFPLCHSIDADCLLSPPFRLHIAVSKLYSHPPNLAAIPCIP
jgi:hypothetical protein